MRHFPLFLFLILCSCAPSSPEPQNLSDLKAEISTYADSQNYPEDLSRAVSGAKDFIISHSGPGSEKVAVVFDIDETVLSNLPHMKKADWGYQPEKWNAWMATANAPALAPIREVYQTAIDRKVAVFFISGRTEDIRSATASNLARQGMGKYEKLILRPRPGTTRQEKAIDFKTRVRKSLDENGWKIIANFGDQSSDLEGGYAARNYKLPNPFYKIP